MGFFFRKSSTLGPFRLNFSQSGLGASVGVKGARLTITPAGTTYVTVGSHGFYYRETLAGRRSLKSQRSSPYSVLPQAPTIDDTVVSAGSDDLVDSSCERLIQQLNQRAKMFNPAWILYLAAVASLYGLALVPPVGHFPSLPDAALPGSARTSNAVDDYSVLTARYGQPTSILFTEADRLPAISIGTVYYSAANLKVTFVPSGCVDLYNRGLVLHTNKSRSNSRVNRELKGVSPCLLPVRPSWTTVGYIDSTDGSTLSSTAATQRLESISIRKTSLPTVKSEIIQIEKWQTGPRRVQRTPSKVIPQMTASVEAEKEAQELRRSVKTAETRGTFLTSASLLSSIGLLIMGVAVHRKNAGKRQTHLFYELDEEKKSKHAAVQQSLDLLAKCHRIWRIEGESATWDWKRNAGASFLVRRSTVGVRTDCPPRLKTNVQVPCVDFGSSQLYFLPDTILYRDDRGYGGITYSDFSVTQGFTRFIESDGIPADAVVMNHTWRYVRKDGGPDRRFNNNRQIPVLRLGVLVFTSLKGLNIQLQTSNPERSLSFVDLWRNRSERSPGTQNRRAHSQAPPPDAEKSPNPTSSARKILGVDENASKSEISAAYHRLAQMYHPDKVAGLAPDFQTLADKRMKEINSAYAVLK